MTNDQLEQIKVDLETIANNSMKMVQNINNLSNNMGKIDNETQPDEFKDAAVLYSQAKNQLTAYLLTVVDSLGLTLLDVIEYVQSSPKQKLWTPEGVR
jgi:hypothetical protein